jgi:hypothetical protein
MGQKELLIDLNTPVVIKKEGQEDKTYRSLILHPFKAKHLRYLPKEMYEMADMAEEEIEKDQSLAFKMAVAMIPLIAALADVDEEVVGDLEVEDLMEVVNNLTPFLSASLPTGKNASGQ